MTQPAQPQATAREEERVLGITYERSAAMIPKLIRQVTSAEPQELGDGYFLTPIEVGSQRREVTVRLGRQGADTRFSVRVESLTQVWFTTLIIIVGVCTLGLGILPLIPWTQSVQRRETRERELLTHKVFRAIEEAVAAQGVATNYRVGPGADANVRVEEEAPDAAAAVEEPAEVVEEAARQSAK